MGTQGVPKAGIQEPVFFVKHLFHVIQERAAFQGTAVPATMLSGRFISLLPYDGAVAKPAPASEEHLSTLHFIPHGIWRTAKFPCNPADGPLVTQAGLDDDAIRKGQMLSFFRAGSVVDCKKSMAILLVHMVSGKLHFATRDSCYGFFVWKLIIQSAIV